ncbi:MAG TPA: hypothetical protein EYQ86_02935 [Bacteroidetes bacterium]|nr:hypothetical protein [Bacteroidota bacterium]
MWTQTASFILKYSIILLLILLSLSAYMGYQGTKAEMSYSFSKIIPNTDSVYIENEKFKSLFGEDANTLVLGVQTDKLFNIDFYNDWYRLGKAIKNISINFRGKPNMPIKDVLSVAHLPILVRNDSLKRFDVMDMVPERVNTQAELNKLKEKIFDQTFYDGLLLNKKSNASIMHITFDSEVLNSESRIEVVNKIKDITALHMKKHNTEIHYSGLPFIRTVMATKVKNELIAFIFLALLSTAVILFILFRSLYMVVFPVCVVIMGVMWSMGLISLLGYKVTILTGLIPPLIVVIGIPNCIYLLNRYHTEFVKHGNKIRAWSRVIEKVGVATFFTNLTTSVGFGVFFLTESAILKEFGLVAGISIMVTFVISLLFIPIIFKFLPKPSKIQTKYLDNNIMDRFILFIANRVLKGRRLVFTITIIVVVVSIVGMMRIKVEGFIVDDIPHDTKEYKDLMFFESNFNGVMPFEILISSANGGKFVGKKQQILVKKMEKAQRIIESHNEFSRSLSLADGYKLINQAYHNGNDKFYKLPRSMDLVKMKKYLKEDDSRGLGNKLIKKFVVDSSRFFRIKTQVQDLGSVHLPELRDSIQKKLLKVFDPEVYDVKFTGTSIVFIAGNAYLVKSLIQSLVLAFLIIALIMAWMFRSGKMLFVCLIPNTIPLIITAGIMGYFNIPLKPSTVLVFSVAYGIAVDTSIHFLAKFQQEIDRHSWDTAKTILAALQETGKSMIYNSMILFCGFFIFTFSSFGGTVALGLLSSITLITAMFTNTILLPSLLMKIEGTIKNKGLNKTGSKLFIKDEI